GIKQIAMRTHSLTSLLSDALTEQNIDVVNKSNAFDTLHIQSAQAQSYYDQALAAGINLRLIDANNLTLSLSECDQLADIRTLAAIFGATINANENTTAQCIIPNELVRTSSYLSHPVFNRYHSETDMLRYMKQLENKDMTLTHSMIPLGSCTMKLNATSEMIPVTWPEFSNIHPFAPDEQTLGYQEMLNELEEMLVVCTGYDAISLQPNAGSQGEYAGLLAIKAYHQANGEADRHICLIPSSAHGTNPASAAMVNMDVVIIKCDEKGNVDLADLDNKIAQYGEEISTLMITYPSTHGVFEESITQICDKVHAVGGQMYVDGANLNAMVGVAAPGKFGADVSHLNLHKTFAIPHGGGGPGMGPIGVKSHLTPFLPGNPLAPEQQNIVSSAKYGSAGILPISYMYIKMMGNTGMRLATQIAILNANYIATRLQSLFPILYTGTNGRVAHECILDIRPLKEASGITEEDIAKRLMDYGFHAPTMSFPVPGTLMVEPTESESKSELDRFCNAMISIHHEIMQVQQGSWPQDNNPLVNAPHTHNALLKEEWDHPYSREVAAYPIETSRFNKVWPSASRIDNVFGDRNLFCACPSVDSYE
ncbi:MAG: aminomethyl-transferring glycine dehydrogenase, partial [Sinobacterium sp.]|nr:aminomethyl-transferring glycine dehydrogenase [Sinobacterium sp.]